MSYMASAAASTSGPGHGGQFWMIIEYSFLIHNYILCLYVPYMKTLDGRNNVCISPLLFSNGIVSYIYGYDTIYGTVYTIFITTI